MESLPIFSFFYVAPVSLLKSSIVIASSSTGYDTGLGTEDGTGAFLIWAVMALLMSLIAGFTIFA